MMIRSMLCLLSCLVLPHAFLDSTDQTLKLLNNMAFAQFATGRQTLTSDVAEGQSIFFSISYDKRRTPPYYMSCVMHVKKLVWEFRIKGTGAKDAELFAFVDELQLVNNTLECVYDADISKHGENKTVSEKTTFTDVDYTSGNILMTVANLPFSEPNKKYKITFKNPLNGGIMAPVKKMPALQTDRVSQLIGELKDKDFIVRETAALELGEFKNARAVEPLIAALKDTDPKVRESAASALDQIRDHRAVEPLIAALKDTDSGVRWRAAYALGETKDPRTVEPLIAVLNDTDSDVRRSAAWALGETKDPRTVEPLIAALKDTDPKVRETAASALDQVKEPQKKK